MTHSLPTYKTQLGLDPLPIPHPFLLKSGPTQRVRLTHPKADLPTFFFSGEREQSNLVGFCHLSKSNDEPDELPPMLDELTYEEDELELDEFGLDSISFLSLDAQPDSGHCHPRAEPRSDDIRWHIVAA